MHHVALLNGCHYLYTDQLGSVGAISKNDGTLVGELLRYEPFGDARGTQPSSDITDRGFTGHRENRDIGLTYMSARYYVGEIGRFASADTLVPDPQNPQSFNRFAYVNNNPLKYTDPSGHCAQYAGEDNEALAQCLDLWNQLGSAYLILQQLGGNGSQYPTDLMNQLLEMGTIKDIQGYIDTIGSAATRLREAHYTSMQSNCTAVGGSIACPPDGPGGAWPKYLPLPPGKWYVEFGVGPVAFSSDQVVEVGAGIIACPGWCMGFEANVEGGLEGLDPRAKFITGYGLGTNVEFKDSNKYGLVLMVGEATEYGLASGRNRSNFVLVNVMYFSLEVGHRFEP